MQSELDVVTGSDHVGGLLLLVVGADTAGASRVGVASVVAAAVTCATSITASRAVLETTESPVVAAHVPTAARLRFSSVTA